MQLNQGERVMLKNEAHKNEVHLHGNLAKEPAIRYTSSGKCVANLTIVTKYEQYSEFHKIVVWEELAEKTTRLKKDEFVKVVGRLRTRSWEDKQTAQKKYATEVIAFQIVIPSDEPAPLTPDPFKGGTAIAHAILSPAKPATPNIHGVSITDDDFNF